jgi:hypothetical protein
MTGQAGKVHLFGVRHHGPGSARSLLQALTTLRPRCILIEGPPEANDILSHAAHKDLEPPVAILVYAPDRAGRAVLYPFAKFSPEWQAIRFALAKRVPVRFIDLPHVQRADEPPDRSRSDPLSGMATAAGYSDTERWWDQLVESRSGRDIEVFAAIHELMTALRAELDAEASLNEQRREAYMRRCIRAALTEGLESIAVVCGAYHTPALARPAVARDDDTLLKGLPRERMAAAWVPWSYERLSIASGYGAGIESPLWYELLWEKRSFLGPAWITRAARLLREADIPISSAHVIETCRLADSLSALRGRPIPGLPEYHDASVAVLGSGDALNLHVISRQWHFDGRLGKVPEDFPATPLQQDLAALQKRLRLPPKALPQRRELDLREPLDLERSLLLRRLAILEINWGKLVEKRGGEKGTFREIWDISWDAEFGITLIDASRHGHTVEQAAAGMLAQKAAGTIRLGELVGLLEQALPADLPEAVAALVAAIQNEAATSTDVPQLLEAIPPLIHVHRYGNVRATDASLVAQILAGLVPRMLIGLPQACAGIDDDAAQELWKRLRLAGERLVMLRDEGHLRGWHETLSRLGKGESTHPLLAGYAHRLLYDAKAIEFDDLARSLSLALSGASAPQVAASWIEGLLSGSGTILIHDDRLRQLLDDWLRGIAASHFVQVLPLLRRTFAQFDFGERRVLGERLAARGKGTTSQGSLPSDLDAVAAASVIPLLKLIWSED